MSELLKRSQGSVPIWEKEQQEAEERRRQSMMLRNQRAQILQQVQQTAKVQNFHPGLFKTSYRESVDASGAVLLSPDGMMWTCCKATTDAAPGCRSMALCSLHVKCSKCGNFYLEIENKAGACQFHNGNVCKPPGNETDICCFQCCMKQVPARGCTQGRHIEMKNYKPNPAHNTGPQAPPFQTAAATRTGGYGYTPGRAGAGGGSSDRPERPKNPNAKKFRFSKIKTRPMPTSPEGLKALPKKQDNSIPIWERERQETEERRRQSMMIRNMKNQIKQEAQKTARLMQIHQGLLKTTYREQFDSSGAVLLSPDGMCWTCCRGHKDSPGCATLTLSAYHEKCAKCGQFYLEIDNKQNACSFHSGNMCKPPGQSDEIICFQCCMKPVPARGCTQNRHQPMPNKPHLQGGGGSSANMARIAAGSQKTSIQDATRDVLLGLKQLNTLVEQHASQKAVITCCKEVVSNVNGLQTHVKITEFAPLIKAVDDFKTAISNIIRAVQKACKENYANSASIADVKKTCTAATSVAKTLVSTLKDLPAPAAPPTLNLSLPTTVYAAPPAPKAPPMGGPPPPPPMMKGPGPSSGPSKGAGGNDRSALLNAINGFGKNRLKKTVTVDKSKPVTTAEVEEGTVEE